MLIKGIRSSVKVDSNFVTLMMLYYHLYFFLQIFETHTTVLTFSEH
jgi:hypothetical protein